MKPISNRTFALIRSLPAHTGLWDSLFGSSPPTHAFEEIGACGEAGAIPQLAPFLLSAHQNVHESAARAITQLAATLQPLEYVQLDEICRGDWAYESALNDDWRRLSPGAVRHFGKFQEPSIVLGIASFHGSGYVRKAAVQCLARQSDGTELPFLLVRLNDWVGPIREAAAAAVLDRIRPDYAPHFFKHLRLVFRLRACGRTRDDRIVSFVTKLLQDSSGESLLRQGIKSNDRWFRRESFLLSVNSKSPQGTILLKEMLADPDPIMRLWAARNVLTRLDDAELWPMLMDLAKDGFMPVRSVALNLAAERALPDAQPLLRMALLDMHASIRALARYWIRQQQPSFDFVDFYQAALNDKSAKRQPAAILGLGETGTAANARQVAAFLAGPLPNTKKAAIRALATLDGDRCVPEFMAALTSDHRGVSKAAMQALLRRTPGSTGELLKLFQSESRPFVKSNLFRLLLNQPFWTRGAFILKTLRDPDAQIAELGKTAFGEWLGRSRSMGAGPNSSQTQALRTEFGAAKIFLSNNDARELELMLQSFL